MKKGKITISRPSSFHKRDYISIQIKCDNSRIEFLNIEINFDDFTKAITGESSVPMEFKTINLNNVGKRKISKPLVFKVSKDFVNLKEKASELCKKYVDTGWNYNDYFNSQTSFIKHDDGYYYAHTTQYKYDDDEL